MGCAIVSDGEAVADAISPHGPGTIVIGGPWGSHAAVIATTSPAS